MADVVKTLKPSGGDYTSLITWEATEQADLVTATDTHTLECYTGDYTAVGGGVNYVDEGASIVVAGWTTNATYNLTIKTPTAEQHDGRLKSSGVYTGFTIAFSFNGIALNAAGQNYCDIIGLAIDHTGAGAGSGCLQHGGTGSYIEKNIANNPIAIGIEAYPNTGETIYLSNNLATNCGSWGFRVGYRANLYCYNNTAIDCDTGFSFRDNNAGSNIVVKNCFADNSGTADFARDSTNGTFSVDYSASSDTTANTWGGTGNRISQTFTYEDSANDDFRITSSDAGAREYGTSLSADANYPISDDIIGTSRPQGSNWDIGFFEVAAGVTATLTGTATASITESDIVTGGKTIILTLTGDTFITGTTSEDGIAAGSDSAQAEANGWDAVVKADLDNTNVVLSGGDTIATITLPAYATYDITAQETITWTIPAASLTTSSSPIVATPTFTIDQVSAGNGLLLLNQANSL